MIPTPSIPAPALDKHTAILGKSGSGKTYTAKGCVEWMLNQGRRVCIIDPTGVWWGLKSSANGKQGAFPVVVFGGDHGDLPLREVDGKAIAEAVATTSSPIVLDTSQMGVGEGARFFTDFAQTLLRANKGPLHLIIDEAHIYAPQGKVPDPQAGKMLHAANNLVSLGRARGLRVMMITQRPAKLHKDSLTQVETLVAMRLLAPQDRAAVKDWISDQTDGNGSEVIASLPTLPTGTGWIWAPELDILKKVSFPKISTFDSSQAPKDGSRGKGPVLAPIELESFKGRLAQAAAEIEANDPVKLKARIRELEKAIPAAGASEDELVDALNRGERKGFQQGYQSGFLECLGMVKDAVQGIVMPQHPFGQEEARETFPAKVAREHREQAAKLASYPTRPVTPPLTGALTGAAARIASAVAFWASIGYPAPTKLQVAAVAGLKAGGGYFGNTLGKMRTDGIIDYPQPGTIGAGPNLQAEAPTKAEAFDRLMNEVLEGGHRKVVEGLRDGRIWDKQALGDKIGMKTAGGYFGNTLGKLSTLGVIVKAGPGKVQLSDWMRELV